MRLLTAVSLVRAQQGEPKKSRLPFGSLLFFRLFLLAQTNCPCAQRPSAVNWRSRCRCRWQKKAARAHGRHPCFTRALVPMENTLVLTRSVVSAARRRNPGHRKSRLDIRLIPPHIRSFTCRSVARSSKAMYLKRKTTCRWSFL